MNQADKTLFKSLDALDNLRILQAGNKKIFLHNEHRWVLPILKWAQQSDALPHPCNLIMFDRHHDYKDISDKSKANIKRISNSTIDPKVILDICNITHHLHQISDLVSALDYQGELADHFCGDECNKIRSLLGWEKSPEDTFRFSTDYNPIWLDFDLDCFSVNWSDYNFPWPEKVWKGKITGESTCSTTEGMTGDWFIKQLVKRAGLITIAREPKHCGSEEESDQILERVNNYLFDNSIEL